MDKPRKALPESAAYQRLLRLAARPYDLTQAHALPRKRFETFFCKQSPLSLHYATQRLDGKVLTAFQDLADELELVEQFRAMRQGRVMNFIRGYECENRQVLHTAVRDLFATPAAAEATAQAQSELARLQSFLGELDRGGMRNEAGQEFTTLINIGIGGSDLGPRAMYEALRAFRIKDRKVYFVANVDPDDLAAALGEVDLARTLVCIASKSGTTLETLTNETMVRTALAAGGLNPNLHCLAVTGKGSQMDDPNRYRRIFYMYDYIGGRYSSTSMVGGVSLGFALGYEAFLDFLRGAAEMDKGAEQERVVENLPLLLALIGIWNRNLLGYPAVAVLPYSQALHRFAAHLQQCDMESNGKSVRRNGDQVTVASGPLVWGEPGTNGQHAFFQLLHQGTDVVPVEFIGFLSSQYQFDQRVAGTTSQEKLLANLLAQGLALAVGASSSNPNRRFTGNRPSSLLLANRLTPSTMGALLAAYEAKIVFQGFVWDLNSFDQEGVQLGKKLADNILTRLKSATTKASEDSPEAVLVDMILRPGNTTGSS